MDLPVRYFTLPKKKTAYSKVQGLSESLAKRRLVKAGYQVSRGSMFDCFFHRTNFDYSETAVFVRWHAIQQFGMQKVLRIAKYCRKNHGTPDLLAAHAARGITAIEIKLGHERIAPHQLETMRQLMRWGVPCEVWRIMPASNKVREKQIDLRGWADSGELRKNSKKIAADSKLKVRY